MPSAAPCVLVIFGASGDLARRKLIPAVYDLARDGLLPPRFALVGYARSEISDEMYRQECCQGVKQHARGEFDEELWNDLAKRISYIQGAYDSPEDHRGLAEYLQGIDAQHGTEGNRLFYLSTPPNT
ncbi:MAG: glucose-6-phosphate dehydrogenase, partial [Phycisphaerales bacterium]|nr:glucose-6-phosphate dehydrogenase [Phycisphaerales bacterium]